MKRAIGLIVNKPNEIYLDFLNVFVIFCLIMIIYCFFFYQKEVDEARIVQKYNAQLHK